MPGPESLPPPITPPEGTLPPPPAGGDHFAHMAQSLDNLVGLLTPVKRPEAPDDGRFTTLIDFVPVERNNPRVIDGLPPATRVEPRILSTDLIPSNPIEAFAHDTITTPAVVDMRTPALLGLRKAALNIRLRRAYNILDTVRGNEVNRESARVARGEFPLEVPSPELRPVTIPERRASRHAYRKASKVGDYQAKQNLLSYLWDDDERSISDTENFVGSVKQMRLPRGEKKTAIGQHKDYRSYGRRKNKQANELLAMELTGQPDKRHARKVVKAARRIGTLGERVATLSAIQQRDRRARQLDAADRFERRIESGRNRFNTLMHEAELHDQGLASDGEPAERFMGVRAAMKRNRAVGIRQSAVAARRTSNLLHSNRNLRDRSTVISTEDGLETVQSMGRKVDYLKLLAKDAREAATDKYISYMNGRADELEERAVNGTRRVYVPFVTTRTAPAHTRKHYQELADKRRTSAKRASDRAASRRSQP